MISRDNDSHDFSLLFRYDILISLSFVMMMYVFYRSGKTKSQQRPQPPLEVKKPSSKSILIAAYHDAKETYCSEDRAPYGESKLGGRFGLFSWLRHKEPPPKEFEEKLNTCSSDAEAEFLIFDLLRKRGSLWDHYKSNNHSFTNYFLTYLRRQGVDDYRRIVGAAYGVAFIEGKVVLYRRDTRDCNVIFRDGFKLKDDWNSYSTRKYRYVRPVTEAYGVSLAKKIPPSRFGDGYFVMCFPEGHDFLLGDIVKSPVNRTMLDEERISLEEVNAFDDIPNWCIREWVGEDGRVVKNAAFSPVKKVECDRLVFRGCY